MGLPIDEAFITMQKQLETEKNNILIQRRRLLQQFLDYAIDYLQNQQQVFDVKWMVINNDDNLKFKDLKIGDDALVVIYNFKFDSSTEKIFHYKRLEFYGKKRTDSISEFLNPPTVIRRYCKQRSPLSKSSLYEQEKLVKIIRSMVDDIVVKMLRHELTFDDERFIKLIRKREALAQDLNRINKRLNSLKQKSSVPIEQVNNRDLLEQKSV